MVVGWLLVLISAVACFDANAEFTASVAEGSAPLEVQFTPASASASASFNWDFGDGALSQERAPVHIFETAGAFTVRLTVDDGGRAGLSESAVTVAPGEAGWVVVSSDKDTLLAGESVQLTAAAFDVLGNPVPDAAVNWAANKEAGAVTDDGVFTAAARNGAYPEAATASFERLGAVGSGTFSASIEPGPIAEIEIEPAILDLIVGQRIPITANVLDGVGAVITDARVTFAAVRPGDTATAGGELSVGSQSTGATAELVKVTATRGSETYSQSFLGTVHPSVLDEVIVTPGTVQLGVNEQVSLQAGGRDRFGNAVALDEVEFSLADEEVGTITSSGLFTASNRATNLRDSVIDVKGWSNGVWRRVAVPLRVVPGPAATIEILPENDSVPMGAGSPMIAIVRDQYGNQIGDPGVQWAAGAGGSITEDGTFVAGFEEGEFVHTVIATVPAGATGNPQPVGTTTAVTVRPRSADMIAVDLNVDADSDVALIDLRTSTVRVLIDELPGNGFANEAGAAWYPDGSRLVFSSDATGTFQIYDFDIETEEVRQLTNDPDGASMPAISPDGSQLAWVSSQNDRWWQIYAAPIPLEGEDGAFVPIERDQATKISGNDEVQNLLPFWSPDGSTIAYTSSRTVTDNDVKVVASDGDGEAKVIAASGYAGLGWSQDGKKVRATVTSGELTGLLVNIDIETGQIVQAALIPIPAFSASWSPDDSEVAVIDRFTGEMWLADTDGTGLRTTLSGEAAASRIAWRPVPITGPAS